MGTDQRIAIQTTEEDAKKAVLSMFLGFPSSSADSEERLAKFDVYWAALCDLPPATIITACKDALRGAIDKSGFLPSAATIYRHATRYRPLGPVNVLKQTEPEISVEERERVKSKMVKWKTEWLKTHDVTKSQTPEEWLADPKNRDLTGVKLSPALLKLMKDKTSAI